MSRDASPIVRPIPEDADYNWTHRAFLQAFQTHGVMTVDAIKAVLALILTAHSISVYTPLYIMLNGLQIPNAHGQKGT